MSTAVQSREVLRCRHCHLNQFATVSGNCRRCQKPYARVGPLPIPPAPEPEACNALPLPRIDASALRQATSQVLRACRHTSGLSQNEMARRFHCERTYVSKIENARVLPETKQLANLAKFFGIRLYWLVTMIEGALEERADGALSENVRAN